MARSDRAWVWDWSASSRYTRRRTEGGQRSAPAMSALRASQSHDTTRAFDCLLERGHLIVELLLVNNFQDLADARSRFHPELEHVTAEQNRRRRPMLDAERARALEKTVHRRAVETAGPPPFAIRLRDPCQQFEIDLLRESPERAVADFVAHLVPGAGLQMLRGDAEHLLAHVVAIDRVDVEAVEKRRRRRHAEFLVVHRADPTVDERRRRRLAEIVRERAEHHRDLLRPRQVGDSRSRLVDHLQRMYPDVPLGMPLRFLRTSGQGAKLRKQRADDSEIHRERETDRRAPRLQQQLFDFAPDAFARQIVERNRAA